MVKRYSRLSESLQRNEAVELDLLSADNTSRRHFRVPKVRFNDVVIGFVPGNGFAYKECLSLSNLDQDFPPKLTFMSETCLVNNLYSRPQQSMVTDNQTSLRSVAYIGKLVLYHFSYVHHYFD